MAIVQQQAVYKFLVVLTALIGSAFFIFRDILYQGCKVR